jgi:hypothetical protein
LRIAVTDFLNFQKGRLAGVWSLRRGSSGTGEVALWWRGASR